MKNPFTGTDMFGPTPKIKIFLSAFLAPVLRVQIRDVGQNMRENTAFVDAVQFSLHPYPGGQVIQDPCSKTS